MPKKMLINAATEEEIRVAIVEDGLLQQIGVENTGKGQIAGNIYLGTVTRLEVNLNAAFVDIGVDRNGFLPANEIHPKLFKSQSAQKEGADGAPIKKLLDRNQTVMVQVSQDPRGEKGAFLTTYISIPGRYLVLKPYHPKNGISRKIDDEKERERLKSLMEEINRSDMQGFIVRTAGLHRAKSELASEAKGMTRLWQGIEKKVKKATPPALIYRETNLAIRTIRDYLSPDIDEILVDSSELLSEIQEFFKTSMPRYKKILKSYRAKSPLFNKYQIEEQIESIYSHKVRLPSGGTIVIDPTEALVAIDVNTGKTTIRERSEVTAYKTNLEAVNEIARQLRLRDLGGLIVIDFIDMEDKKHQAEVEKTLKQAFKGDKARVRFSKISSFGLMEMSRQRLNPPLETSAYVACPHCSGSGKIKSATAHAYQVYRKIQTAAAKKNLIRVDGALPPETAGYLLNEMRRELNALERDFDIVINLTVHAASTSRQALLQLKRKRKDGEAVEEISV